MNHWWDNVVKTIVRKGVVSAMTIVRKGVASVEWLHQQSVVLNQEINPKVVQGLHFPCATIWKETMHRWNTSGKANFKLHLTEGQKDLWKNRIQQIGKGQNPLDCKKRPKKVPASHNPPNCHLQGQLGFRINGRTTVRTSCQKRATVMSERVNEQARC